MSADFRSLFERSRYFSQSRWLGADDAACKQRMDQQERFAAAALGFALSHDSVFRSHFLERICGLSSPADSAGWEVFVEPQSWGDLVFEHRGSRSLIVCELKVDAELKAHQDPSKEQFTKEALDGNPNGYGGKSSLPPGVTTGAI